MNLYIKTYFVLDAYTVILLLILGLTISRTCPESTPCTYRQQYSSSDYAVYM